MEPVLGRLGEDSGCRSACTPDCDEAIERLRSGGVTVIEGPIDLRWGNRACKPPLSAPLTLSSDGTRGGFNAYGSGAAGFSDVDEQLCQAFAAQASIVVSNVRAYWASVELSRNLSRAMESRAVIDQAKGILMSTYRISADDAFDLLVARSQTENRKLREVAGDVVREALGNNDA